MNQQSNTGRILKFISWNIRGINDPSKRFRVKSFLRENKADLVCLQETKLVTQTSLQISQLTGIIPNAYTQVPATGRSGGIIVVWNSNKMTALTSNEYQHSIEIDFQMNFDRTRFKLTAVYGPPSQANRHTFFSELQAQKPTDNTPWIALGDFNQTLNASDRSNNSRGPDRAFVSLVASLELIDLPLVGRQYTWSRGADSHSFVRLDRVLISNTWNSTFPNTSQKALYSNLSDHCPIQCTINTKFQMANTFRMENYWLRMTDFRTLVTSTWNILGPAATTPFQLSSKLQVLRSKIKQWA